MFIGIDMGSSFLKIALISSSGEVQLIGKIPTIRIYRNEASKAEYDFEAMAQSAIHCIDEIIDRGMAVDGILISTQMHGFVPRLPDGRFGSYISWQDEFALEALGDGQTALDLLNGCGAEKLLSDSGIKIKPELALCSLFARVQSGELPANCELYTLGSCLIYRLCGKNITHITNAAPTGLWNLRKNCWNRDLLEAVGLSDLKLPTVRTDTEKCGMYRSVPVYPDIGDQQAALRGANLKNYQISLNLGTAAQISVLADTLPAIPDKYMTEEIRPYFDGKYLRTVTKLTGGRSLQILVDFLRLSVSFLGIEPPDCSAVWDKIEAMDTDEPSDLRVSTGFYPTQIQPEGSISNIGKSNFTPQKMFQAAFEDCAERYGHVIETLRPDESVTELVLSGGRLCRILKPYLEKNQICSKYRIIVSGETETIFLGLLNAIMEKKL